MYPHWKFKTVFSKWILERAESKNERGRILRGRNVRTVGVRSVAKTVEEVNCVNMDCKSTIVDNVKEVHFVNTSGSSTLVDNVKEVNFANTAGASPRVKSVMDRRSVSTKK
jgi:hypothetical protein